VQHLLHHNYRATELVSNILLTYTITNRVHISASSPANVQQIPEFIGGATESYLILAPLPSECERTYNIVIYLRAMRSDGIVLYAGHERANEKGDFIAVFLHNYRVHYVYQLGSGVANVS
jgi:hypothetical protein